MSATLARERSPYRDPGWLVVHYVLAIALVAVLLCVGQFLIQRELLHQEDGLRQTEAVQDQMLLSHRLDRAEPEVLQRFEEAQIGLDLQLRDDAEAFQLLQRAHPHFRTVVEGARSGNSGERERVAGELLRQALENLVVHINQAGQSRLHSLRLTELSILFLVLATLAGESLLVFRPAAHQIRELFCELEATRLLLSKRLKKLNDSHESIKADLKSAAEVQRSLLPKEAPEIPGYRFAWSFKASHDVAGDMFNLIRLDETRVGVYILDVSGHGVPAALLSVSLSRAIVANVGSLLKRKTGEAPYYQLVRPAEVARELNRRFPVMSESDQFFTLLYGIIDTRAQTFTFVQAGHPGPIHVSGATTRTWEAAPDPPIGIIEDVEFGETTIRLSAGDLVCLYTDGVIEARGADLDMYGLSRVIDILQDQQPMGVASVLEGLYQDVRSFTNGQPQKDDMTLVGFELCPTVIERGGPAASIGSFAALTPSNGGSLVTRSGRFRSGKPFPR
jgi:serine phosphatase RsbU (regulator of sigma subunit)